MKLSTLLCCLLLGFTLSAQDDLLSLLGDDEEITDYTIASFKTNRIMNLHSIENTAKGVLDFKINHRFGRLNSGVSEFFGLDQAMIRIGMDYGITDRLMIGVGRSNHQKVYDGFAKFKVLRQSKGKKTMPITLSIFHGTSITTMPFEVPERDNLFSSRVSYAWQLLIGRKFSDRLSLQISPTVVHRNLVATAEDSHDVYALGLAGRFKLTKRTAFNAEYVFVNPDNLDMDMHNSLSIGFDIETGGHVFQLHLTNSTSMVERGYVTETDGSWADGDIHFGFNISRVFTAN